MGKEVNPIIIKKATGLKRYIILFGLCMDGVAIFCAAFLASLLKFESGLFPGISSIGKEVIIIGSLVSIPFWWLIFAASGAYLFHWDRGWGEELKLVIKPVTSGVVILFFTAFLISPTASIGRWIIIIYYLLMILFIFLMRVLSRLFERRQVLKKRIQRIAFILGIGNSAQNLAVYLKDNPALGYNIVGFVECSGHNETRSVEPESIIGTDSILPEIFKKYAIEEVLVTVASNFHNDILSLLLPATGAGVKIKVVPDLFDIVTGHIHSTHVMGHPLMEILPQKLSHWQSLVKIMMDYLMSVIVLLFTPVWILIAIAIKIDSRGSVFYLQDRVGKGGKVFRIFKFRSMRYDAEKASGPVWAEEKDERITRVGNFLRKSRLDEVPQFLNVLKGEMSVIGPRPERPAFMKELISRHPFYQKRLIVKPGITGWSQVKLGYDTNLDLVEDKLKYDFFYIENQSIFLDLEILARTMKVVLTGAGAH